MVAGGFSRLSAEAAPSTIADLTPAGRRRVQGRHVLAGRLLADEAEITLRYGGGAPSESRTYRVGKAGATHGRVVSRFWAQQRVAELSVQPAANHDELLHL